MPAIVFDIGGVLVPDGNRQKLVYDVAAELAGAPDFARFKTGYLKYRDAYDLGVMSESYWTQVLLEAGVPEEDITDDALWALAEKDGELCSGISDAAFAVLNALKTAGAKLYILSNAPWPMVHGVRESDWYDLFDGAVFSAENLLKKPDKAIYQLVENSYGIKNPVFFDDRAENVQAAKDAGWDAVLFTSIDECVNELKARGFALEI